MSDILKRVKDRSKENVGETSEQKSSIAEPAQEHALPDTIKQITPFATNVHETSAEAKEQKEQKTEASEIRIFPVVMKGIKAPSNEEALNLYEDLLSLAREILKENVDYKSIDSERITAEIEKIVEHLNSGSQNLLKIAYEHDGYDKDYFFYHSANVCVYSIVIGIGHDYDKSKLLELGKSAFLHDTGMTRYMDLCSQTRRLTVKEYNDVKNHTIKGAEILEKVNNLEKICSHVAYQEHERIDGSGYSRGLKREDIHEYALIVGLVDMYEALSHLRPYRNKFSPLQTLQILLENKHIFKYRLIKTLLERIGIFPVGCVVHLNTKEVCQVIRLNYRFPLRPTIKILSNPNSKESREEEEIDLTKHPTIYIIGSFDTEDRR